MNIISIDLPWKEKTKGRTSLAVANLAGEITIFRADEDAELRKIVRDTAEPGSMILLDIPIEGCDKLRNVKGKRFRPVDKALAHQGIWILPSYTAKMRGQRLKESLKMISRQIELFEIYPYAIYKFLAYLKKKGELSSHKMDRLEFLFSEDFRNYPPPKYKREKNRNKRQENMGFLYSVLTDSRLGLRFPNPLRRPNICRTFNELDRLCDEYDACLGAVVGLYWAKKSGYACLVGNSQEGNVLLLADQWLQTELKKEVQVRNREKEFAT